MPRQSLTSSPVAFRSPGPCERPRARALMSLASGYRCSLASPPGRLAIEKEMMAVAPLAEAIDSASAIQGWAGIVRVCARSRWRRGAGCVARLRQPLEQLPHRGSAARHKSGPGPGYLTRIRARLPGRVRDANPDRDTPGAP